MRALLGNAGSVKKKDSVAKAGGARRCEIKIDVEELEISSYLRYIASSAMGSSAAVGSSVSEFWHPVYGSRQKELLNFSTGKIRCLLVDLTVQRRLYTLRQSRYFFLQARHPNASLKLLCVNAPPASLSTMAMFSAMETGISDTSGKQ